MNNFPLAGLVKNVEVGMIRAVRKNIMNGVVVGSLHFVAISSPLIVAMSESGSTSKSVRHYV